VYVLLCRDIERIGTAYPQEHGAANPHLNKKRGMKLLSRWLLAWASTHALFAASETIDEGFDGFFFLHSVRGRNVCSLHVLQNHDAREICFVHVEKFT